MKIKAAEIARRLNLSKATVSLALNNKPGVSEQTKAKIFDYINRQEKDNSIFLKRSIKFIMYRGLDAQSTYAWENPFLIEWALNGIESVTKVHGFSLEIEHFNPRTDSIADLIDSCNSEGVAGVILQATEMAEADFSIFRRIKKPLVVHDNLFHSLSLDQVTLNNDLAVYYAFRHLMDFGHKKLMYLAFDNPIYNIRARSAAANKYKDTFPGYKIDIFNTGKTVEDVTSNMTMLLSKTPHIATAFVCESYVVTLGLLRSLFRLNLHIPREYSVVNIGTFDFDIIPGLDCRMTCVEISHEKRGGLAARRLIERIENPLLEYVHMDISPKLMSRESVRRIQ